MKQPKRLQVRGYTLFEMLVSLALVALILMLLMIAEMQATRLWRELDEEEELAEEGSMLMQMISRDLKSASHSYPIKVREQSELFFLKRTPSDELVAVGYFVDPNKKNLCYRFCAQPKETLITMSHKNLTELESRAAAREIDSEVITKHLLSSEITPIWNSENEMTLLEISLALEKRNSRYFLSTVIALPR